MKSTAYVTHSDCSLHDPGWRHPEHQGRLPAVARAVYRDMLALFDPLLELEARPATSAELELAHTRAYVDRVRERAAEAADAGESLLLEGETLVSGASYAAAVAAAGAALTAVDAVLGGQVGNAFCAVRPPGHGAGRESSGRFALFNPVAIAARALLSRAGVERVLIVEVGDRLGVGTWEIVRDEPRIALVAVHGPRDAEIDTAPSRSAALPAGAEGEVLLSRLRKTLDAAASFRPDFVLLSLGCDALWSDPLGELGLHAADYHPLTLLVRERAEEWCAGRLVSVLEEGYDTSGMARATVQHLRALAGLPPA